MLASAGFGSGFVGCPNFDGGKDNNATGTFSTTAGGQSNGTAQLGSTVGGGKQNQALSHYATVGAGIGKVSEGALIMIAGSVNRLNQMSSCYCHSGRAGGTPLLLSRLFLGEQSPTTQDNISRRAFQKARAREVVSSLRHLPLSSQEHARKLGSCFCIV